MIAILKLFLGGHIRSQLISIRLREKGKESWVNLISSK